MIYMCVCVCWIGMDREKAIDHEHGQDECFVEQLRARRRAVSKRQECVRNGSIGDSNETRFTV